MPADTDLAEARFRRLTGETDTTAFPQAEVYDYLNAGLEATNAELGYFYKDNLAGIALVAGTQYYALPDDYVEMVWVYHSKDEVKKGDTARWTRDAINWRNERGQLLEYAIEGQSLVFRKVPNAECVAKAANPTMRYVAAPPDVSTGLSGLLQQDRRIPVYWAVVEFASAHPDGPEAAWRSERFTDLFARRIAASKHYYESRRLAK